MVLIEINFPCTNPHARNRTENSSTWSRNCWNEKKTFEILFADVVDDDDDDEKMDESDAIDEQVKKDE
jgi:hypothetical protein